ncbi:MAG: GGDEF domain-containing protein [Ardenticatenia bacterium]|nr:GGDEF domain-containing protein [Ardenticatenia bacterium]
MSDTRVKALKAHIASLEARIERLSRLAYVDERTGIYTWRALRDWGARELARARLYGRPLGLVLLHVHGWREINEVYGAACGEELITALAELCDTLTRPVDVVALVEADTLAVLLPEQVTPQVFEVAAHLVDRIHVSTFLTWFGELHITVCAGMAEWHPADGGAPRDFAELVARASRALERAHTRGEGYVVAWSRDDAIGGEG